MSRLHKPMDLVIAATWNGDEIASEDVVTVSLEAAGNDLRVRVEAPFHGDPPPPGAAGPTPRLWEHEVVELFVAEDEPSGPVRYLEVELSPHGHHLVLRLEGVRQPVEEGLPLDFVARIDTSSGRWTGEAIVPAAWLPPGPHRVNAFAIHGSGSSRRYLVWSPLPGPHPDFHQPGRFPRVELALDQAPG